jgi:hypothetical protein
LGKTARIPEFRPTKKKEKWILKNSPFSQSVS